MDRACKWYYYFFLWRKILQKMEYHNGLDIAVAENTQAVAVKSGIVTEVRNSETLGKVLKYETEDGYTVMYAHLNNVLVK